MRLALLKGNRFNPWHLRVFNHMPADIRPVAFRAESEVQERMAAQDDGSVEMPIERIEFQAPVRSMVGRIAQRLSEGAASPRQHLLPFHDRLQGYDAILSWELFTDWTDEALEAKRRFGVPVALVVWDNIPFNHDGDEAAERTKARAVREADLFVVHTERSRRMLHIEGVEDARIRLIPHGVDAEAFTPGAADRPAFGLAESDFVILFVGWLLPRKGIDFLLLALDQLRHDPGLNRFSFKLHAVGSGPGKDRVARLIDRLKLDAIVKFTDGLPYDRMIEAYRAADVFALPSIAADTWQEQFGMSLMEAMSSGIPCVSTWSGSIPEILGDAGTLCQPNDFLALYEAIRAYALDPSRRQAHSAAGRRRVLAKYSLGAYASGLNAALREIAKA